MDGALAAMEIQEYARIMFPDLPPDQAVRRFYRTTYECIPECIRSQLPEIGAAVGGYYSSQGLVFASQIASLVGWGRDSTQDNTTNEQLSNILNQMRSQTEVLNNIQN